MKLLNLVLSFAILAPSLAIASPCESSNPEFLETLRSNVGQTISHDERLHIWQIIGNYGEFAEVNSEGVIDAGQSFVVLQELESTTENGSPMFDVAIKGFLPFSRAKKAVLIVPCKPKRGGSIG